MQKNPEDMTLTELEFELSQASDWFTQHGHTLPCGEQDRISDYITELEVELNKRVPNNPSWDEDGQPTNL